MIAATRHRLGAGVLVVDGDAILLTHHVKPGVYDFWSPPGGGVHPGEDIETAARREAFEETNLVIEPERLLYVEQLIGSSSGTHHTKLWFVGRLLNNEYGNVADRIDIGHPEAVRERIVEARFVKRDEFAGKLIFPGSLEALLWSDLDAGFAGVRILPIRMMLFE